MVTSVFKSPHQIMLESMQRNTLLGLPAELRIPIYEYAVQDAKVKLGPRMKHHDPSAWTLLSACRQVRQEAYSIFFAGVQFEIRDHFTEPQLREMLEALGSEAVTYMKKLNFALMSQCSLYGLQPEYVHESTHEGKHACSHTAARTTAPVKQ